MSITGFISAIIDFFTGLWDSLPESTKDKLIDAVVESFTVFFEAYFDKEVA